MKNENIPADIKSKSLKESREEIDRILGKLENQDTYLEESLSDYQKLIQLNNHIQNLFKKRFKEISEQKKNDKKKLIKKCKEDRSIFNKVFKKTKKILIS